MRLVKKRGCEKIRNYFFTCLFLCITKWFLLAKGHNSLYPICFDIFSLMRQLLFDHFFIMPNVSSTWIDRFIRSSAHWILSRFFTTSWCIAVISRLIRTFRFLSVFLQHSANGHPSQFSHSYTSSCRKRQRSGSLP